MKNDYSKWTVNLLKVRCAEEDLKRTGWKTIRWRGEFRTKFTLIFVIIFRNWRGMWMWW